MATLQMTPPLRAAIMAQTVGMVGELLFLNGIFLSYFALLGVDSANVALLLTLPNIIRVLLFLHSAHWSDRFGKRRLGSWGLMGGVVGYLILIAAAWVPGRYCLWMLVFGLCVYSIGNTFFSSNFFSLINPHIPADVRGQFLGRLRVAFRLFQIVFTMAATFLLSWKSSHATFSVIIGVAVIMMYLRIPSYRKIPESELEAPRSLWQSTREVMGIPGYLTFGLSVFLINLLMAAGPRVLNLLEQDHFSFTPGQIVMMGNIYLIGTIIGHAWGGHMVDRWGARMILATCILGTALSFFAVLLRGWIPLSLLVTLGGITFLMGITQSICGMAISTEILTFGSLSHSSMATALNQLFFFAGMGGSGLLTAILLKTQWIYRSWSFLGQAMNEYDTIFVIRVILIVGVCFPLAIQQARHRKRAPAGDVLSVD